MSNVVFFFQLWLTSGAIVGDQFPAEPSIGLDGIKCRILICQLWLASGAIVGG